MSEVYKGIIRLKSSHDTVEHKNRAIFEENFSGSNLVIVGTNLDFISISNEIQGIYPSSELMKNSPKLRDSALVTFSSKEIVSNSDAEKFLLDLASSMAFSWPLNKLFDHRLGSLYVEVDLKSVRNVNQTGPDAWYEGMGVAHVKLEGLLKASRPSLAHKFIYDGLRSTFLEAKYFSFFLMIEMIEKSAAYKRFHSESLRLYSSSKWSEVTELTKKIAEEISPDKKLRERFKNGIQNVLQSHTIDNRHEKLRAFLQHIGVNTFKVYAMETQQHITTDTIKQITDIRNKMFHGTEVADLDDTIPILIAICIEIAQVLTEDPKILE